MVARIYLPAPFKGALNYNEKKLQKGNASCIHASGFPADHNKLNFYDKLHFLEKITSLNERAKKSGLHISLNFDPSEKISKEILTDIANIYMEKIGFGDQPYLVYQHHDAGHPHIHIVSTLIQTGGKRIGIHNIGKTKSEPARKQIEEDFHLVKAKGRSQGDASSIKPAQVQKALYGKSETKQSISNVLQHVIGDFKFTSLPELNAVLKQYNVIADGGTKNSRVYQHHGLNYFLLGQDGNKIGLPIKASLFHFKPTLENLEKKIAENEIKRQPYKTKLKNTLDWALANKPRSLENFIADLKNEKVQTVARENKDGLIYGLLFIDYRTKSVFTGSDIGKAYSAKAILEKLGMEEFVGEEQKEKQLMQAVSDDRSSHQPGNIPGEKNNLAPIPEIIIDSLGEKDHFPFELKTYKNKKKEQQSNP